MHSNLRDQQLKIIMYMHRYPYINLRVTKTQKSIIDIVKIKENISFKSPSYVVGGTQMLWEQLIFPGCSWGHAN